MRFYLIAAAPWLALSGLAHADDSDDAPRRLQGAWRIVDAEMNGKSLLKEDDVEREGSFVFTGAGVAFKLFQIRPGTRTQLEKIDGTYKLDDTRDPKRITIEGTWTTVRREKPATFYGIYQVDGDSLKILLPPPETEPPTEFATKPGLGQRLYVLKREKAKDERKRDASHGGKPTLTLKAAHQPSKPERGWLFVLEGCGGGRIHRAGPEHFKLARVSNGQAVSLFVEYDRETLDEQDRLRSQGSPRNPDQRLPALKQQYAYNVLFRRVRLFLDNGRHDGKDAMEENDCLDLYARAKLAAGERYRLTWACWPVGAVKATEVSLDFRLGENKESPPTKANDDGKRGESGTPTNRPAAADRPRR